MKVLVLGAGGIVGQELRCQQPEGFEVTYTRTEPTDDSVQLHFTQQDDEYYLYGLLDELEPDVVINLAGVNDVDKVERGFYLAEPINVLVPQILSGWCEENGSFLIQCSTQGVFSGEKPPYSASSPVDPVNEYGRQKARAEGIVLSRCSNALVARLTFVYGIRPFNYGRVNPLEIMMSDKKPQLQVNDRFFSPLWSKDAAAILWELATSDIRGIVHLGEPVRVSRYTLACHCAWETARNLKIQPVSHEFFEGIAERPYDTTWDRGSLFQTPYPTAILNSFFEWRE
jgi:dTDP-4-dehydrorhamnose reductase